MLAAAAVIAGCPLPFEYTQQGWSGNASAVDPSTPDVTATPSLGYTASSGSAGTLSSGSVTTDSDTAVTLVTNTPGAVIYYATDGSTPDPRSSTTSRFTPGSPIMVRIASPTSTDSRKTVAIGAMAIGPNMKPSAVMSVSVTVQYPQAAAPVLSVPAGLYHADQALTMSTATAGATIYYTKVSGSGPAPTPVPGQAGTTAYTGPVTLTGMDSSGIVSISALSASGQLLSSGPVQATYTFQAATPSASPGAGTYIGSVAVLSVTAPSPVDAIYYTTDGSTPSSSSNLYMSLPIGSTVDFTLGLVAYKANYAPSVVSRLHYTVVAAEYDTLTPADIASQDSRMTQTAIDNGGPRIPVGTILLYKTDEGRYGKMVFTDTSLDSNGAFQFRFTTYAADGTVWATNTAATDHSTNTFDLDYQPAGAEGGPGTWDIWYNTPVFRPYNTARFYLAGIDPTP